MRNFALTVLLTLSAGLMASLSAAEGTISGTVKSISGISLTVAKDDSSTEEFTISKTTKITVDGKEGTKKDIAAGEKITVTSGASGVELIEVEKPAKEKKKKKK